MKYEKATVEIVNFDDHELFMNHSTGTPCDKYAKSTFEFIFTCYSVEETGAYYGGTDTKMYLCKDVSTASAGVSQTWPCSSIDYYDTVW